MRILHILSHNTIGGGQVVVSSLVKALSDMSQSITLGVVLPPGGPYVKRFIDAGFETFTLPLDTPFLSSRSVRKVISGFTPEIIHTHERAAGYHIRSAVGKKGGYRLIHSFHGFNSTPRIPLRRLFLKMEDSLAERTNAFICVSGSEAKDVYTHIPKSRGKIQVIQNSIDGPKTITDASVPLPKDLEAWFSRHTSDKIITMIARPEPVKNHDLAFEAIGKILGRSSRYAFLFVGLPPTDRRVRNIKRRYGDAVYAIASVETAAPVIKRSWALFLPSHREGSPLVVLEGFALGVPTIGARVPGISDIIQEGWNGYLMDPIPEGLGRILSMLENDPTLYENVRIGAKEQGSYLNMRSWARQYADVYRLPIKPLST